MSETIFERDDYEHQDDGIGSPEDELTEDDQDTLLEEGYSPPERPRGLDLFGTTPAEEREGETLDQRLAQEEPDPNASLVLDEGPRSVSELDDDGGEYGGDYGREVGDARAGRLVDPDLGGGEDTEKDLVGLDVGVDGAGASAEEAAVHVVDLDEADAAIARDEGSTRGSV